MYQSLVETAEELNVSVKIPAIVTASILFIVVTVVLFLVNEKSNVPIPAVITLSTVIVLAPIETTVVPAETFVPLQYLQVECQW